MALNIALKVAIIESGFSQVTIAHAIGMDATKLSQILHGWRAPSDAEQKAIAKVLRRKVTDVFPLADAS